MAQRDEEAVEMHGRSIIAKILALSVFFSLILFLPCSLPAEAQEPQMKLSVTVYGRGTPEGRFFYEPAEILVATPGILINITFVNDDNVTGVRHDLTLVVSGVQHQTPLLSPGESAFLEFAVNETGSLPYWCSVPGHRELGMEGTLVVGLVPPEEGDLVEGLPLRAYWIGLIGIFSMVAVIIVSYFVIKYESGHHADQREHRRRGLP